MLPVSMNCPFVILERDFIMLAVKNLELSVAIGNDISTH
jgi:hypothetical protein